jgi:hypothetical protein
MRRGTLVLGLLLALTACSVTVTVDLPDQSLDLPGLTDTGGKVVYPKDGLSFSPPPVDVVRGIRVEGVLKAETSQPLNITLEFYARTQDPSRDPACTAPTFPFAPQGIGVEPAIYLCSIGPNDQKVGQATFQNSQQASFTLQGTKLAEGIKAGRLWLGIKASGLPSTPLTLTFLNMKAYVTVGL